MFRVGDRVTIRVQLVPGQDDQGLVTQLRGTAEVAGIDLISLEFEPNTDHPEVLEASFKAEKAGAYLARVLPSATGDAENAVRAVTLPFKVEPPQQEFDNPRLNRALLDDLARTSGGKVFTLAETNQIPAAFKIKQVDRLLQYRQELWECRCWRC